MFRALFVVCILLLFSIAIVAQEDNTCPALVTEALATVDESCAEVGRNQACYGHTQVEIQTI